MNSEVAVLEALYDKINAISSRGVSTDARTLGHRAALARARVFVLDERTGVMKSPL